MNKKIAILALLLLCTFKTAQAHTFDVGTIDTSLTVSGNQITMSSVASDTFSPADKNSTSQFITDYVNRSFFLKTGDSLCTFVFSRHAELIHEHRTLIEGVFECPAPIDIAHISIQSIMYRDLFENYEHYVHITKNNSTIDMVFTKDVTLFDTNTFAISSTLHYIFSVVLPFFKMGISHILSGTDHILFILMLVLVVASIRSLAYTITAFTIGHTLSLLLTLFGIVHVQGAIVEPLIALTIIYVALHNIYLIYKGKSVFQIRSVIIALFFGLIHGLGFAGAFTQSLIPKAYSYIAFILFSMGIEFGQVCILCIAFPVLYIIRKNKNKNTILMVLSVVGFVISLYWLCERVGLIS